MAGTGQLDVVRFLRQLQRQRVSQCVSGATSARCDAFAGQTAVSIALGMVFLTGARGTFGTSNLSVAALLYAFLPTKFPVSIGSDFSYLEAFRHLWVLAVESRTLALRDADSLTMICRDVDVHVKFEDTADYKDASLTLRSPCCLPELKGLKEVFVDSENYWPLHFRKGQASWKILEEALLGGHDVKLVRKTDVELSSEAGSSSDDEALLAGLHQICVKRQLVQAFQHLLDLWLTSVSSQSLPTTLAVSQVKLFAAYGEWRVQFGGNTPTIADGQLVSQLQLNLEESLSKLVNPTAILWYLNGANGQVDCSVESIGPWMRYFRIDMTENERRTLDLSAAETDWVPLVKKLAELGLSPAAILNICSLISPKS